MPGPIVTKPAGAGPKTFAALGFLAVPAIVAAVLLLVLKGGGGVIATPASIIERPVLASTPAGDRVYLLTSQWKTFKPFPGSNRSSYTNLLVDVWSFDATNAKPVWRHRIADDRSGVNMGRLLLGAQGGVLWVLQGDGLIGLSLEDGAQVADAARIEAANPALKGLLPTEARYYRFDAAGLGFTAADGRSWRLNGQGLKAVLAGQGAGQPLPDAMVPAHIGGGNSTWSFMDRGVHVGQTRWLGLLDEAEAKTFGASRSLPGGIDPTNHPRTRLWSVAVGSRQTFFGPQRTYSDFRPLPEGPEYLQAGLLTNGVTNALPILLFKPDSLLVLHRDRLGAGGHLQLSRASGPAGKVVWTADLPMDRLESVMQGKTSIVLFGHRDEKDPTRPRNDKLPVTVDQLVAIDSATGKLGVYGFKVLPTKGEVIPASSTTVVK